MTKRICTIFLGNLIIASSLGAQNPVVKLNGGLEASVLKIGRSKDNRRLTISLRLANKGTSTAYLLLVGDPLATDNTGGSFKDYPVVNGLTYCHYGNWATTYCLGIPQKVDWTVPLQNFTELDPNPDPAAGITVNLILAGQGDGPVVSFSSQVYLRLVKDPLADDPLPDAAKYKQFRLMTLSFPPTRVEDAP
jgi:hypothetical protein